MLERLQLASETTSMKVVKDRRMANTIRFIAETPT